MQETQLLGRRLAIRERRRERVAALVDEQPPGAVEEPMRAFYTARAPRFDLLERPHEHLVEPKRVGAETRDDLVRVDDIAAALAHLVSACIDADRGVGAQHEVVALFDDLGLGVLTAVTAAPVR